MYEYRVVKGYRSEEWDFELAEGDIVNDAQFPEPDIPADLIGRGVLEPADTEAEAARLADPEPEPTDDDEDE